MMLVACMILSGFVLWSLNSAQCPSSCRRISSSRSVDAVRSLVLMVIALRSELLAQTPKAPSVSPYWMSRPETSRVMPRASPSSKKRATVSRKSASTSP